MFITTEEQEDFRQAVRQMCEDKVAPRAAECDEKAEYPWHAHEAFTSMGVMGLSFPEEYGGSGADHVTWAICMEEIARVDAAASLIPGICDLAMTPVIRWGSHELKSRILPPICQGRAQASYCLSEAEAGSDVASMTTRAERDGDEYVINGRKQWITNAGISDYYVVFAKTDRSAGHRGISAFVVEKDMPGFSVGKLEHKLGIRASPTGEVILEDVRVPAENLVGEEGKGFYYAMGTFDWSRPAIGAQAVGIAQGALDYSVGYMSERKTFGQQLTNYQGLQFMVADMSMLTEAARALVYQASAMIDTANPNLTKMASMAKCFAGDTAMKVTTDAVQLLGGYGFTKDFPVERMFRDAKITQIYEGTNQIQRMVIARKTFGNVR
ncbi:MAG TPA: acyl-CoA dehydrogenase family protein [Acidimicrobiia bacterium]|nr:acyl-CoA dehydrogenase family protein [Acidimicrobiia bacterium]